MDISTIASKLSIFNSKPVVRKAEEFRRLFDVHFNSSSIGIGEVAKAIICLELAASRFDVLFNRQSAIRMSGMSEKAYMRAFNSMQNGIGFKSRLDVRELGIQFGCIRLIPFVVKGLSLYKERFTTTLPLSRRASTDFNRPVFTAVAFYLCAKRHKLKVDKLKLIELCGTSESEFTTVSASMDDLCFDVFGISKEKKNSKTGKEHQDLLDEFPTKRRHSEDEASDVCSGDELENFKKQRKMEDKQSKELKSSVASTNGEKKTVLKTTKHTNLNFRPKCSKSIALQAVLDC